MAGALSPPRRPEIDQYTIKLLIGSIALLLPILEIALTRNTIDSISASFWYDEQVWPRNIFVGFLFVITALLVAYNGKIRPEMVLGRVAALAAFLVAMFPCMCGCKSHEIIPGVHAASAAVMFAVLTWFCWHFYRNAKAKTVDPSQATTARRRIVVYWTCAIGMVFSIAIFAYEAITGLEKLVYWGEAVGLVSFGISWLTASRKLPVVTKKHVDREPLF